MSQEHELGGLSGGARWRSLHSTVGTIVWGLILVWFGLTAYMDQASWIPSGDWFAYFLAGLGIILIVEGLVYYESKVGRYAGRMICGAFIAAVGLMSILGAWESYGAFIIVAVGVVLVAYPLVTRTGTASTSPATQ